jgi:lactoylglutathione lyase
MNITHVAVYVSDLDKSKDYYTKFFGGSSNEMYVNAKGFKSYFITFDSGARLELMSKPEITNKVSDEEIMGWSHVAFSVGDKEKVIQITEEIVSAGYKLLSGPRTTGDGYFESCVTDPDGNRVEITE